MADFKRVQQRATFKGVNLACQPDQCPQDQLLVGTNVRNVGASLTTRDALAAFQNTGSGVPVHSIKSFSDGVVTRRYSGAGPKLYQDGVLVDTGFSGNPLSFASYQPSQSVQPFLYVADSARYSKIRASDGTRFQVGIVPPASPPDSLLTTPRYAPISDFDSASGWVAGGTAGAITAVARVPAATTINEILFDTGSTGWACVNFTTTATAWIAAGARIIVGSESSVIQDVIGTAMGSPTTVAQIAYDSGVGGPCCVVLAANSVILQRDSLIKIGAEYVRVLSVAIGEDNNVSFRCSTSGFHAAGDAVAFYFCARMYFAVTHANGEAITGNALTSAITGTVTTPGVGTLSLVSSQDLSNIGGRAVGPNDWMHVSVNIDILQNVSILRILLDIDNTTNDFLHNYYYAEITNSVFQQASIGAQTSAAAQTALVNLQATQQQISLLQAGINFSNAEHLGQAFGQSIGSVQQQITSLQQVAQSYALALGGGQWSEVFIPISGLVRVGNDQTVGLDNIKSIRIEATVTAATNIKLDSWWIGGTYGPNAPESISPDNPIKYHYRYRSTITGATSTPSPLNRHGLFPSRQGIQVSVAYSTDPQCDTIDIARVGASINGTPLYVGSIANNTAGGTGTFLDDFADAQLGDAFDLTVNVPWPVQQLPVSGTCTVVGTSVFATSVAIPTNLCIGTTVLINGIATVIRGLPTANAFQIEDSIVAATGATLLIASPTTFGNPLPYMAGPFDESLFAAGDPLNPGRIYFANRTNPEGAATSGFVDLTSSGEPILGMLTWNGYVVAMTGERFFGGTTTGNLTTPYAFSEVPTGCGLLAPWAFAPGPQIYFWTRNGIAQTALGPAQIISKDDLYPYLPHEGVAGVAVNGYAPPPLNVAPRLAYCKNGWLYFDFLDINGTYKTLAYKPDSPGWWFDSYTPGVALHYQDEATNSITVLCGCANGTICQFAAGPNDSGGGISCAATTAAFNLGDFRALKQFGDAFVDATAMRVDLLADNLATNIGGSTLVGAQNVNRIPIDIGAGLGAQNVNLALALTWTGIASLYGFEISALPKPERTQLRTTDWIDLGQSTWLQGFRITANTFGVERTIQVQWDGAPTGGGSFTLKMNHDGEVQIPYSFAPVIAHRIRLTPTDSGDVWEVFAVEPIGTPAPEATGFWHPQPSSFGVEGYLHVRELRPAVMGTGSCVVAGSCEYGSWSVTVALSGAYQKVYVPLPPNKGMFYDLSITGAAVRVFADDFEVVAKQWASNEAYGVLRPFGQPGTQGARI